MHDNSNPDGPNSWPPPPSSVSDQPPPQNSPGKYSWIQAVVGFIVGLAAYAQADFVGNKLLLRAHLIVCLDRMDGEYNHKNRSLAMIWTIYVFLFVVLLALQKFQRYRRFAKVAFWTHLIVGSLLVALETIAIELMDVN